MNRYELDIEEFFSCLLHHAHVNDVVGRVQNFMTNMNQNT